MFRKVNLTIVLVMISAYCVAQSQTGIRFGPNFSSLANGSSLLIGFHAGVVGKLKLSEVVHF